MFQKWSFILVFIFIILGSIHRGSADEVDQDDDDTEVSIGNTPPEVRRRNDHLTITPGWAEVITEKPNGAVRSQTKPPVGPRFFLYILRCIEKAIDIYRKIRSLRSSAGSMSDGTLVLSNGTVIMRDGTIVTMNTTEIMLNRGKPNMDRTILKVEKTDNIVEDGHKVKVVKAL